MVDEIRSQLTGQADTVVVYIYCKDHDSLRDNFVELVRSLINSLLGTNEICLDYLYDVAVNSNERYATTVEILSTVVVNVVQCYERVFIGIDGLDECEPSERSHLVSLVQRLLAQEDSNVHVFLTSRAEHDLEQALEFTSRLKLTDDHVAADIRSYTNARRVELARFHLVEEDLRDVSEQVAQRSAGKSPRSCAGVNRLTGSRNVPSR